MTAIRTVNYSDFFAFRSAYNAVMAPAHSPHSSRKSLSQFRRIAIVPVVVYHYARRRRNFMLCMHGVFRRIGFVWASLFSRRAAVTYFDGDPNTTGTNGNTTLNGALSTIRLEQATRRPAVVKDRKPTASGIVRVRSTVNGGEVGKVIRSSRPPLICAQRFH